MKHIALDFDDFSYLNNRFDLLFELREHFPKLKVSMFTIPFDPDYELGVQTRIFKEKAVKVLRNNLDWVQIIPHGLTHMDMEFLKADRTSVELSLQGIDEIFTKDKIKYEKGFKPPFWQWNQDVVDVLNDSGWWGAIDPRTSMLRTKKFYQYDFLINEPFWKSENEVWKLHGHIDGRSQNDIEKAFLGLMKIPPDAEFHFVTDFIEEEK
jgi:hypothetical protein